jgi:hypothetical protein
LERVKSMPRNASAADADSYRPDLLHEDEPRYLRRQKPVEIRRKKFGGRSASFYRRAFVFGIVATALVTAAALAGDFLYHSPQVALLLRNGTELALIDAHGVILDRPRGENFQFPIVTGLSDNMSREERGRRM